MTELTDTVKSEISTQFIQGYDFFKERANQPWLKLPEISVQLFNHNPSNGPTYVHVDIIKGDETDIANILCPSNEIRSCIELGAFLHEGAEIAYFLARKHRGFLYSRDVGEFVGNLIESEIKGRLAVHKQSLVRDEYGLSEVEHEITTTKSLYDFFLESLQYSDKEKTEIIVNGIKRLAKEQELPEHLVGVNKLVEMGMEPYVGLIKYTKANDLIHDFMQEKEDPSLIGDFLYELVETEEASNGIPIDVLFNIFKLTNE